jgi:hypothetical protein
MFALSAQPVPHLTHIQVHGCLLHSNLLHPFVSQMCFVTIHTPQMHSACTPLIDLSPVMMGRPPFLGCNCSHSPTLISCPLLNPAVLPRPPTLTSPLCEHGEVGVRSLAVLVFRHGHTSSCASPTPLSYVHPPRSTSSTLAHLARLVCLRPARPASRRLQSHLLTCLARKSLLFCLISLTLADPPPSTHSVSPVPLAPSHPP